jgi:hypothetical protein
LTPQGHGAAGRIKSVKNSNDPIGNRTCDLPGCRAVPQPTAPPRGTPSPPNDQRLTLICSLNSVHFDMPRSHVKELLNSLHMQQRLMQPTPLFYINMHIGTYVLSREREREKKQKHDSTCLSTMLQRQCTVGAFPRILELAKARKECLCMIGLVLVFR